MAAINRGTCTVGINGAKVKQVRANASERGFRSLR